MAALTVQRPSLAGATPTYNACAAGGDTVANDGRVMLHFKNGSGGSITVTIDDPISQLAAATAFNPDVPCVIAAGAERIIGPFPTNRFGDTLALSYSGVTSLTCAVMGL